MAWSLFPTIQRIACSRRHVMPMPNWASILNQLVIRFDNGLPLILNQLQRLLTDSVFAVGSTYTESNTRGVRCNLQQRTPSSRLRVIIQLTNQEALNVSRVKSPSTCRTSCRPWHVRRTFFSGRPYLGRGIRASPLCHVANTGCGGELLGPGWLDSNLHIY